VRRLVAIVLMVTLLGPQVAEAHDNAGRKWTPVGNYSGCCYYISYYVLSGFPSAGKSRVNSAATTWNNAGKRLLFLSQAAQDLNTDILVYWTHGGSWPCAENLALFPSNDLYVL
jgi:hypothetical protein